MQKVPWTLQTTSSCCWMPAISWHAPWWTAVGLNKGNNSIVRLWPSVAGEIMLVFLFSLREKESSHVAPLPEMYCMFAMRHTVFHRNSGSQKRGEPMYWTLSARLDAGLAVGMWNFDVAIFSGMVYARYLRVFHGSNLYLYVPVSQSPGRRPRW